MILVKDFETGKSESWHCFPCLESMAQERCRGKQGGRPMYCKICSGTTLHFPRCIVDPEPTTLTGEPKE